MKKVKVGLIGSGFVTELHMYAYKHVFGLDVEVVAVSSIADNVCDFAKRHNISSVFSDYRDLIGNKEIDVVDICTPPALHAPMIQDAIKAGKHVISEKPFTGYFGFKTDQSPIGEHVPKALMYERVMEEMQKTVEIIKSSGQIFMYAEDWVYAPAVAKMAEMIRITKDKILFMKGEESHSGSHAPHAARWDMTGGGSLIRMGCHPLSAALYLKQVEALSRGEKIHITDIVADVGCLAKGLSEEERRYIKSKPIDVEDWACLNVTFSDGTKSTTFSGDIILGGVRNYIETYTNSGVLLAKITPNDHLMTYMTEEEKLENIYITEKVDRKTGWQFVCLEEEWARGYNQEIQDFMECVAYERQPLSGIDLAQETVKAIYGGYWSAEAGKRVRL